MSRWLRVQANPHGEWSVTDLRRAYRICAYNHGTHGGVHIHVPEGGPIRMSIAIDSPREAMDVVVRYAEHHDEFDAEAFRKEVKRWKSESKNA